MTLREMTNLEKQFYYKEFYKPGAFSTLGIEVVENSSQEICAAMVEINARIDGSWSGPSYRIRDFLTTDNIGHASNAFLAASFVKQNEALVFS